MLRQLFAVALLGAAASAFAANLQVPQDYPTIQSAIDAAPRGATVVVAPFAGRISGTMGLISAELG